MCFVPPGIYPGWDPAEASVAFSGVGHVPKVMLQASEGCVTEGVIISERDSLMINDGRNKTLNLIPTCRFVFFRKKNPIK